MARTPIQLLGFTAQLNSSLRHEIRHLLDKDSEPPYNNERLIGRLKTISAGIAALAVPTAIDMRNTSTMRDTLHAGISPHEYVIGKLAISNPFRLQPSVTLHDRR